MVTGTHRTDDTRARLPPECASPPLLPRRPHVQPAPDFGQPLAGAPNRPTLLHIAQGVVNVVALGFHLGGRNISGGGAHGLLDLTAAAALVQAPSGGAMDFVAFAHCPRCPPPAASVPTTLVPPEAAARPSSETTKVRWPLLPLRKFNSRQPSRRTNM